MQESVRRIIEAEEARMGKDYNTIYLFHKFRERREQYKGWVVRGGEMQGIVSSFPLLMKHSIIAVAHVMGKFRYTLAYGAWV